MQTLDCVSGLHNFRKFSNKVSLAADSNSDGNGASVRMANFKFLLLRY